MTFPLRLIPLMPFIGAALLMLFGRKWSRDFVFIVAPGAIGASALVAFDAFFHRLPEGGGALTDNVWTWMQAGGLKTDVAVHRDPLPALLRLTGAINGVSRL